MRSVINIQYIFILLVLYSCQNSKTINKIKSFSINFQPSFISHSKLTLSRDTDSATFRIDTSLLYSYQIANPILNISKVKMESSTSIDSLWDPLFANSLKNKNQNLIAFDGMGIFIEYVFEKGIDTVFLSNTYPKTTDTYFYQQLKYLEVNTNNLQQKGYLKKLMSYF